MAKMTTGLWFFSGFFCEFLRKIKGVPGLAPEGIIVLLENSLESILQLYSTNITLYVETKQNFAFVNTIVPKLNPLAPFF